MAFNPYLESAKILSTESPDSKFYRKELRDIQLILEDVNSPVTRLHQEKLFQSLIDKSHIDFGDIAKSQGDIKNYSGYPTMVEVLNTMERLALENKAPMVELNVKIVKTAIDNISGLSSTYRLGFTTKTEYVALEYDTYVYFCVEATTALIYNFVEVLRSPEKQLMEVRVKNTKLRADEFYFEQLIKFNKVQEQYGIEYRKMLENMCNGKNNFIGGTTLLGVGAVTVAAMAIVPITREIIYQIYNIRGSLSNYLALQSKFLELNASCVANNETLTADKRSAISKKQNDMARTLMKMSDTIRIKSTKSILDSKKELEKDNKMLTINNIKDEVSNSPFELI